MWTLNQDTIANHSYYVAIYAHQIARLIQWDGHLARLLFMALVHDLDETVTGDIVSPVKRAILDVDRYRTYVGEKMQQRMPDIWNQTMKGAVQEPDAALIIEAADRLDAFLFLLVERRMGNAHVFSRCKDAHQRFIDAWYRLPAPELRLRELMENVVGPALMEHEHIGSNGV